MSCAKTFLAGCDVHDKTFVTQSAGDLQEPELRRWENRASGRQELIRYLKETARRKGAKRVVLVYEASGCGFGLYDEMKEAGIECYVLAPTRIRKSSRERKVKNDARDALRLLEVLRGHVLAGNELPSVWVPDAETRDDRERVRARLDVGKRMASVKTQIVSLLRRTGQQGQEGTVKRWSRPYRKWVTDLATGKESGLGEGSRTALGSLLRQLAFWEQEEKELDRAVAQLTGEKRYAGPAQRLMAETGVGITTALVFLTEMGDLSRFANRRKVAAYLGLTPSTYESGENEDRKGHISHEGPARVRKVLCQAMWYRVLRDPEERTVFRKMVGRNPKKKKVYLVAMMRRLAIRMWHRARHAA